MTFEVQNGFLVQGASKAVHTTDAAPSTPGVRSRMLSRPVPPKSTVNTTARLVDVEAALDPQLRARVVSLRVAAAAHAAKTRQHTRDAFWHPTAPGSDDGKPVGISLRAMNSRAASVWARR